MPRQALTATTATPDELSSFLKSQPWPAEWASSGRKLEWLWTFCLDNPPEALWESLSDTSAFNARLGFPEMHYEEREGRLHGSSKNLGRVQEWVELPWEWTWGRGLSNVRVYSKGLAKVMRSRYEIESAPLGGTRIRVYIGWIPRSGASRFLLQASASWVRDSYARLLRELDAEVSGKQAPPTPELRLSREQALDIRSAAQKLRVRFQDPALGKRLENLLLRGSDEEVERIRPKALAALWQVPLTPLLRLLLFATREGLLRLTWDVVCPHCRGLRSNAESLGALPQRGSCEACGIDFDAADHRNLDVTFHPHPALREAKARVYCAAEPARKPHRVLQASLAPGERRTIALMLPLGAYRARSRTLSPPEPLEIAVGAPASGSWTLPDGEPPRILGQDSTLELVNSGTIPQTFMLEQWESDRLALRPGELFNFQDFRDLFSEEAVATGVKLDVGRQCLLFTDLVGSTRFCATQGDSVAFARVHDHFRSVTEAIKAADGAVVKTIGDACMAAFNEPAKALAAALEIQRRFPAGGLRLRVTLHHGPCLAVNLNSHIDYFGSTVNYAAKLQSEAGPGELVYSAEFADQPGVRDLLDGSGFQAEAFSFSQSWDGGASPCFRIKVS